MRHASTRPVRTAQRCALSFLASRPASGSVSMICLGVCLLLGGCAPPTVSYSLPAAEREELAKNLRLEVPAALQGPLDGGVPSLCEVDAFSFAGVGSPDGLVAVIWRRTVDGDRFERVVKPGESPFAPAAIVSSSYRVKRTDQVFKRFPRDEELIQPGQAVSAAILPPPPGGPPEFLSTDWPVPEAEQWLHGVWFWRQGSLHCVRAGRGGPEFARAQGGRISSLSQAPVEEGWLWPCFVCPAEERLHVFGVEHYHRPGEPPPCFGGSESHRYWHLVGDVDSLGGKKAFRDYYAKWHRDEQAQILRLGPDRFGLVFMDHGWDMAFGFESHPVCFQDDLLGPQRWPASIADVRDSSTIVAVAAEDGSAAVVWMEQVVLRNRPEDVEAARVAAAQRGASGRWAWPVEIARGQEWDYVSFAAAGTPDGTVFAAWRDAQGRLAYVARNRAGQWGNPVATSLRIGPHNRLVAMPGRLVLVTWMKGNLYWCDLPIIAAGPPATPG